MSKIRMSAESLNYYLATKTNTPSKRKQSFASFIQDEAKDDESDVPRADSSTSVNLTKRQSNNTPVRTLQLAFEDEEEVINQGTQSPSQEDSRSETNKPQKEDNPKFKTNKRNNQDMGLNENDSKNTRGKGHGSYPSNDKQTAQKNILKASKSSKTKKNLIEKEPSLINYSEDDAEVSEPKILEEHTKSQITRREGRGVKNTAKSAVEKKIPKRGIVASDLTATFPVEDNLQASLADPVELPTVKRTKVRKTQKEGTSDTVLKNIQDSQSNNKETNLSRSPRIGKTSGERKLASEALKSIAEDTTPRILDIKASRGANLKPKHGIPRKSYATTPKDESKMNHSTPSPFFGFDSHKKLGNSSHKTVTPEGATESELDNSTEQGSDIISSESDDDSIFSSRLAARSRTTSESSPALNAFQTPVKHAKMLSPESSSTTGSTSEHQSSNLSDSSASVHRTPRGSLSFKERQRRRKERIPQNKSLLSHPKENSVQPREETSALKRKNCTDVMALTPHKRQKRSPNKLGQRSVGSGTDEPVLIQAVEENNREAGNSASYSVAHLEPRRIPSRFNPYSAPSDNVFRARLLLSDEQYQVNWLYLEPGCVITLKMYAPTMFLIVSGSIQIKQDETPSIHLMKKSQATEIGVGHRCIITSTGITTAIFQTTEKF